MRKKIWRDATLHFGYFKVFPRDFEFMLMGDDRRETYLFLQHLEIFLKKMYTS